MGVSILKYRYIDTDASIKSIETNECFIYQ